MVPMASRLRARCAATALATPTPPTSSVVRPTRVRNWREALDIAFELRRGLAPRADFPAGIRERGLGRFLDRRHCAIAAIGRRQPQPVLPAHQAAGLQQPGGAQRGVADEKARTEAKATGKLVRLAGQRRAQLDGDIADGDAVAGFQIEPRQQRRIDGGAERAVLLREQRRKRQARIGRDRTEQRIGGIDSLDLDQRRAAVAGARHRPQSWRRRRRRRGRRGSRARRRWLRAE